MSPAPLIRSANAAAAAPGGHPGEPSGGFWVRWHDPSEEQATLWMIEWDPSAGGAEDDVWRAVEVLAGGPVPR